MGRPSRYAPAIPVIALVMPGPAVTIASARFSLETLLKYSEPITAATS